MISVVAYTAEKLLSLLATTRKSVEFETISEFTLRFQSGAKADVYRYHEEKFR
jgi:hypothetical protein